MTTERFKQGWEKLKSLNDSTGDLLTTMFEDVCPDLTKYIVEFPFGDIFSRPGLDLRSREIATLAALVTLGSASAQLKAHIGMALNIGISETEIKEIILQMAVYAGFPAAINAMLVAKEVFQERQA